MNDDRRIGRRTLVSWALALSFSCGSPAPDRSVNVLLTFELQGDAPRPHHLRLTWTGEAGVVRADQRVPAAGALAGTGPTLGTLRVDVAAGGEDRTFIARGLNANDEVVAEGVAHVSVGASGSTAVSLGLGPAPLPDTDGDGFPDLGDSCPRVPNPTQGPCSGPDGTLVMAVSDAGAAERASGPSIDVSLAPADAAQPEVGFTDARLGRGRVCSDNDDCETKSCRGGKSGRFCASPDMAAVPGGVFMRGCDPGRDPNCGDDERPAAPIDLAGFEIDVTEVTQQQYQACIEAKRCLAPATGWDPKKRAQHPVTAVPWQWARDFCVWAGKRLPTEAEWEKAARGSVGAKIYPWGDGAPACTLAQYAACGPADVTPVGLLAGGASDFGVQDMAGNAAEWVSDFYAAGTYATAPGIDPKGPDSGELHVSRGGSYQSDAAGIRVTARMAGPANQAATVGFRCARSF